MQETALVVQNRRDRPFVAVHTPFQDFYEQVLKIVSEDSVSRLGVTFGAMPLARMLAVGAYPLLIKASGPNMMNIPLSTADAVRRVSAEVNRVVSIGLVLKHQTMDRAATVFVSDVVSVINTRLSVMKDGDMTTLEQLCQLHVAKFLASCWKQTTETAREFADRALDVADANRSTLFGDIEVIDLSQFKVHPCVVAGRMAELHDGNFQDFPVYKYVRSFSGIAEDVESARALQTAMRSVLTRRGAIPGDVLHSAYMENAGTLDVRFLTTHLLLGALNAPADQEFLTTSEMVSATNVVLELDDARLVAMFFARMSARGAVLSTESTKTLTPLLCKRARERRASARHGHGLDERSVMFLHVTIDDQLIGADEALMLVTGHRPEDADELYMMSVEDRYRYLTDTVVPAIVWSDLDLDSVLHMVGGVLPMHILADGIVQLEDSVRESAMHEISRMRGVFTARSIARFEELGLLKMSDGFVERNLDQIGKERLMAYLTRLVVDARIADGTKQRQMLVRGITRISAEDARRILSDPQARHTVADSLFTPVLENELSSRAEFSSAVVEQFLSHIGDLSVWYALANDVLLRIGLATSRKKEEDEFNFPEGLPWCDLHKDVVWVEQAKQLSWSSKTLKSYVRGRYTEEAVFRWVMEHWDTEHWGPKDREYYLVSASTVDDGWALYKEQREAYYASYGIKTTV